MKIVGIDLGDQWVGIALSDGLGITCSPYTTATPKTMTAELIMLLQKERVGTIVIGLPTTMQGAESAQTAKIREQAATLEAALKEKLTTVPTFVLWDERLSSKRANTQGAKGILTKEQKIKEHARAAAFILQTYLDYQAFQKSLQDDEL